MHATWRTLSPYISFEAMTVEDIYLLIPRKPCRKIRLKIIPHCETRGRILSNKDRMGLEHILFSQIAKNWNVIYLVNQSADALN